MQDRYDAVEMEVVHDAQIARVLRRNVGHRLEHLNAARDAQPGQGGRDGAGGLGRRVPANQHIPFGGAEVACQRQDQSGLAAGHHHRLDKVQRQDAQRAGRRIVLAKHQQIGVQSLLAESPDRVGAARQPTHGVHALGERIVEQGGRAIDVAPLHLLQQRRITL